RAFDLSHYLSAPSVIVRRLTGRWILFPNKPTAIRRSLFSRFYEQDPEGEGAYIFLVCRKSQPASVGVEEAGV
ncbi:MAG TPA: hypothetical protein VHS06_00320, partial [Chloroflexota bacterium]|nr:hypothetical protein [Chloroflexota bacterium]